MRNLIFLLLIVVVGSSCVPNRKIVYLQKGDELNESFPKDSVLRTYDLADYEYRIQPEDILSIRIQSLTAPEFDIFNRIEIQQGNANPNLIAISGYLVDRDGFIQLPELGKIQVAGLTIHEIKEDLQVLAEAYITEPVVNVRLLNFRATILGEVNREGTINSFNNRISMIEALGLAGGLSDMANRKEVKVIRQKNGQTHVLYVNLLDENYMSNASFFIHQNDIVIVPPLRQRPFRKYFGQNVSLFLSSASTLLLIINLLNN